jgi:hypothetical protein
MRGEVPARRIGGRLVEFWLGGGGSPVERRRSMKRAFVLDIPHTLEAACDPRRLALLIYDMQVGIAGQLPHGLDITARVGEVLSAAREGASACSSVTTRRCPSS